MRVGAVAIVAMALVVQRLASQSCDYCRCALTSTSSRGSFLIVHVAGVCVNRNPLLACIEHNIMHDIRILSAHQFLDKLFNGCEA